MAILVNFSPTAMSVEKYDELMRRLNAAGQGSPQGRLSHVAFGDPAGLRVIDIWDSPQALEAFGAILMPMLGELGVTVPPPDIGPVHNQVIPRA